MSKERSTQFERFYLKACEMMMMEKIATGDDLPIINPALPLSLQFIHQADTSE